MVSRSQAIAHDVSALLRSRSPLLWIVTRAEARVEAHLVEAAASASAAALPAAATAAPPAFAPLLVLALPLGAMGKSKLLNCIRDAVVRSFASRASQGLANASKI